ncbi:heparan-sulfate 6-O-sulfotransferase 2-like [Haliotis cracherodii]|uniref:heparan-sulfate 6-O-sulfotransferase 2-like n=1 Tax=Haliotis cracherodii TaxID=6455 RepID=UPI0039E812F9
MKAWKGALFALLVMVVASILFFGYFCFDSNSCALTHQSVTPAYRSDLDAFLAGAYNRHTFREKDVVRDLDVNTEEDVFVFLHIQKTGGTTFGKHLVDDLDVDPPCFCYKRKKKHCDCYTKNRKIWLFSRFSTGWSCGLHPDWTELTTCVDAMMNKKEKMKRRRRYLYITILRNPVKRFLSEWMHVRRGATWKTATLACNKRSATLEEVPFCYDTVDWKNVSIDEFMNCPHNLAINRQSRMLANLTLVNCYNTTGMSTEERNAKILASAKENLRKLAFFGLTEVQNLTQKLFEHTFGLEFADDFVQWMSTRSSQSGLPKAVIDRIIELNRNDIYLYQYAKDLFHQRVTKMMKEMNSNYSNLDLKTLNKEDDLVI